MVLEALVRTVLFLPPIHSILFTVGYEHSRTKKGILISPGEVSSFAKLSNFYLILKIYIISTTQD